MILVRWFDKNDKAVDQYKATVSDLGPGETHPFTAYTSKNPDIVRYDATVENVFAH
jgi:hypothetical protein